jgi:DNA-binding transcriptional LysR family regulator
VSLSEAGERFLARVGPALSEIAGALEDVNEFRDTPAGTLRIDLMERAAHHILRPVVAKFLRRRPDINVELTLDGRAIDIVAEGFDAGIRLAEAVPQDMIAIPCGPDTRFIVVGAPGYLARAGAADAVGSSLSRMHSQAAGQRQALSLGIRKARRANDRGRAGPAHARQ